MQQLHLPEIFKAATSLLPNHRSPCRQEQPVTLPRPMSWHAGMLQQFFPNMMVQWGYL